ncbi:MAG: hypothetical protein ABIC40_08910, partial [bacterium]
AIFSCGYLMEKLAAFCALVWKERTDDTNEQNDRTAPGGVKHICIGQPLLSASYSVFSLADSSDGT